MSKALRALVVEDSPTMRQLLVFALSRIGDVEVVEAGNGVEGLRKLREQRFDVIVTDINMPLMDGLKLISMVRRDEAHRDVPIVVVTTEAGAEDRRRALSLGADAYIVKPIQANQVIAKVKQLLQIG